MSRSIRLFALWTVGIALSQPAALIIVADEPVASEVTFRGFGDFELSGTLLLPAAASAEDPAPAVLLLPGSGPTDRDGNQRPMFITDVLKEVAERLAREGVATLRFDKRAVARYAPRWPKDMAAMNDFFAWEPFVEDAKAAFRVLQDRPEVDEARTAILGHSEGGLIALSIARDLAETETPPAGLILAGTAGRTIDYLVREQITTALNRPGISEANRAAMLDSMEKAIAEVRDQGTLTVAVPPGLRALFNPTTVKLLHAYFTIDPVALAKSVRGPALVLNGAHDNQVSAERDAPPLAEALRNRERGGEVDLVIVPGTSHNLKKAEAMESPGYAGPVEPAAMDAILAWVRARLLERESR